MRFPDRDIVRFHSMAWGGISSGLGRYRARGLEPMLDTYFLPVNHPGTAMGHAL